MKRLIYHLLLPALMPVLFFRIATTPVEVLGCRTRGSIAALFSLVSGLTALVAAIKANKAQRRKDKYAIWWVVSSIILAIPVVAFIILA